MVEGFGSERGGYEIIEDHDSDSGNRADHSVRGSRRRLPALTADSSIPLLRAVTYFLLAAATLRVGSAPSQLTSAVGP